jgi:glycosyltransferase involved in cell wall biosynthesis
LKIAMVSEHASPLVPLGEVDAGGQNVFVAELSAAMCRLGHDVVVYTRRDRPRQLRRVETDAGYEVVHVPAGPATRVSKDQLLPHMGAFAEFLVTDLRRSPVDVIHAHFWMSGFVSLLASRATGIPVVQTFHALGSVKRRHQRDADTSPPKRIPMERGIGAKAARVLATSSDEVFELLRMGVARSRISVVPCGVDTELFSPNGPRWRPARGQRLVTVGRLVPRKGVHTIIGALPALPNVELLVAGGPPAGELADDPEARRLVAHAQALGVADRVGLLGQVDHGEIPSLLRSADVVLCTPWYEPFGMVALEAMACGRPVIATAVGGLTDTVVDGVTGVLVPPRNPLALAAALRRVLGDPTTLVGFGLAGCDRARARYTWERVAIDTLRNYERVLGRPSTDDDSVQAVR